MTGEYTLRRNRAIDPHWFDFQRKFYAARERAAAEVRFPVARDEGGRFSHERNDV